MPIRWRLTLYFAIILSTILALSGLVLNIVLQQNFYDQLDNELRIHSANVHGTLDSTEIPQPVDYDVIHSKLPPINEFASPGVYIQLIDRDGSIVVKSDSLGEQELPVDLSLIEIGFSGTSAIKTVAAGDNARVRVMVSPLYLNDQTLLLEVAQSLNVIDNAVSQLGWALVAAILLAFTAATILGSIIVKSALSPVSRVAETAKDIENSTDLSRRVDYEGPLDEVGRLAVTFDHMIEHLDRAFQSQKHFIADASHELRGPITVISGNIDLLKRKLSRGERHESLKAIEKEASRMSRIVDNLLLLAEIESGPAPVQQTVSLKQIVKEEVERARLIDSKHIIEIGRQEDLKVRGDGQHLRQLLSNLVDNAVRYTPEGGSITISLFRDGDRARLEVVDSGIGIAPEHLTHIFERFYRADRARSRASGSIGLGLAIVKGIAEQHGGEVKAESQPGQGSILTVWLKL